MSVDPEQPSDSESSPPKTTADPSAESADSLRLKRRFKKGGSESEEGEKPDQTIQLLSTLLQDLIAKKDQPGAPEPEAKATKYHRLSKSGSGTPAGSSEGVAPGSPATAATPDETAAAPVAGPVPTAPPPPVKFRAAPVFEPLAEARRRRRLHILYILGALGLAGAAYIIGQRYGVPNQPAESSNRTPALSATVWTDSMLTQIEQALVADQAGDLKGAERIASAITKPGTAAPPGLDLYLASVNTRREHTYDVEANLLRAVGNAPPEEAAVINERLAFNFSRARDFEKAAEFYKTASKLDPFPAPLYYHWGEALRHLGHFDEADANFRRALDRLPTGQAETESLRECILFKQRLALVEQGQDAGFQTALAEQLKAPLPSGYWLLTAAAVALQHKNLSDAAGFLGRARDMLGAPQFEILLNDYFFRAYADRKELADFFPLDPAARRAKLLPTMTYSIDP